MPRCLQCSEAYTDSLRRCPHCGAAPEGKSSGGATKPVCPGINVSSLHKGRFPPRQMALVATVCSVVALLITIALPGTGDDADASTSGVPRRVAPPRKRKPRLHRKGIHPGRIEFAIQSAQATLLGDQVLVEGKIAANAAIRATLDGTPLPLGTDGTSFQLLRPHGKTSFQLMVEDIDGKTVAQPLLVSLPDSRDMRRLVPVEEFDGHTFHRSSISLKMRPGSTVSEIEVTLDHVENIVLLPHRTLRLYRAPLGYTYFRTLTSGQFVFLRESDSQEDVLIPGGISRRGTGADSPNGPQHIVRVSAFLIDRTEVTAAQYGKFLDFMARVDDPSFRHREDAGTDLRPSGWDSDTPPTGQAGNPVSGVSWFGAYAYARWVGGRLPTEAEWERAAAGPSGQAYPWGDVFDRTRVSTARETPLPARSKPSGESPYGLLHTVGNVREWCEDRFDPRWYRFSARVNPRGPAGHRHRVVRGGSHLSDPATMFLQHRDHEEPGAKKRDIGFRVARTWPAKIR